jgi:hypothetical protein
MDLLLHRLFGKKLERTNDQALALLRQSHPDRPEPDLVRALGQAMGLTEPSGHVRLVEAARLLLD